MNEAGIIKNKNELATGDLRRKAVDIIEAGIQRVLPNTILPDCLSFDSKTRILSVCHRSHQIKGRLFVIGGGKASGQMAQTLENLIGIDAIESGIVVEKAPPAEFKTAKIQIVRAGHPLPDWRGVEAVNDILQLKKKYAIGKDDFVLCLISGGGSALMPSPVDGLSLDDKQSVTRFLISCGADISEINTVRKHLSKVKGGRLAQYFAPARVLSLILSDVVGNDLSIIASGPTYPDPSTYLDAYAVLENYGLLKRVPESVITVLVRGCGGEIEETSKSLHNVCNYIIGDNRMALEAMAGKARQLGLDPHIITAEQVGDTETVARQRAKEKVSEEEV